MEYKHISIKQAAILNASAKYLTVILQIIYMGILSRILTPEQFGIVAVIHVFIVFFQLFADMGFGIAVVQNKSLTDEEINHIFTFTVYLGIALMLLFWGASFIIAAVYDDKIYIPLGSMLSFSLLFNALNMIPNSVMLKNKKFVAIAIRTVVIALISYSITIILAFAGLGVYALATNAIVMALGFFLWNEFSVKLKFRWRIEIVTLKKVWSYSLFQFGAQTLNYFNRNLDNLLIGKFFTKADLGYYNKSYTLAGYPVTYLPGVITPVLHPILSEHQDDKEYIYNSYIRLLRFLSLLGCFGAAFCFFASEELILIAFGQQWEASIVPFKILSISLWMQILTNTMAPIYQSIGNTKLLFKSTILTTLLIVSSIIVGVFMGSIVTVSVCVSVAYILNFFISFMVLIVGGFRKSFLRFGVNFLYELMFFIILLLCAVFWPFSFSSIFISFIVKLISFGFIYLVMLLATKQHKVLISIFKR